MRYPFARLLIHFQKPEYPDSMVAISSIHNARTVIGEPIYENCVIPTASPTTSPTAFPGDDVRRLEGASQLDTDRGLEEASQQQRLLGGNRGGATLLQGPVSWFNCDAHPFPIQILKGSEDLYYSVNELNIRSNGE